VQKIKAYLGGGYVIATLILAAAGGGAGIISLVLPELGLPRMAYFLSVALASAICACFGLMQQNHALRKSLEPGLKFSAGPDVPGSSDIGKEIQEGYVMIGGMRIFHQQEAMRWLRVVVETIGDAAVKECIGELTGVTKDGQSLLAPNKFRLTWQPGFPNQAPRTVHPHTPEYLDVLAITESGFIKFATPGLSWDGEKTEKIFEQEGDYIIQVAVKTETTAFPLFLRFEWRNDWKTSQLRYP
jgi:hypothetical protein